MRLYYRCSCVSPRRHKPLFTIIVARSRDILRINSFVFAFRHPSYSDFSSYLRFSPGSYCFYPTHVIPMQLYQGFWQLRVFSFFTRRVTSIKFRHFRINIGYDYFHISLFLIFVYFLYLFILSYLPYFYFFYKYESIFLFPSLVSWWYFSATFQRRDTTISTKRRITNFFSRVRVFVQKKRGMFTRFSLFSRLRWPLLGMYEAATARFSKSPRVFSSSDSDLICRGSYYLRKTRLNNVRVGDAPVEYDVWWMKAKKKKPVVNQTDRVWLASSWMGKSRRRRRPPF